MRCLLDKVTARYAIQGMLKLAEHRELSEQELFTLDLLSRAISQQIQLFIPPPTANILHKIAHLSQYEAIIQLFLDGVVILFPSRYFKRWARRLRDCNFGREDAAILALATFGTDAQGAILGMDVVATYDQPMIHHWFVQQEDIQKRFTAMKKDILPPYSNAALPLVLRPEQVVPQ